MLRSVRIRVPRDELLGVCETESEQEVGGAFKVPADADSYVLDVEARKNKVGGRGDWREGRGTGEAVVCLGLRGASSHSTTYASG